MRKFLILLFIPCISNAAPLHYQSPNPENVELIKNNKILAEINNQPITTLSVLREMDILFAQQFPEYVDDPVARYQFYSLHWKTFFKDCVEKELILADAKECKMEVKNGDIQQEMKHLYGPNIIQTLHDAGVPYHDAFEKVKSDITLRRMLYVRVNRKATNQITPKQIRSAYEKYVNSFTPNEEWTYHVISVREEDLDKGFEVGRKIYQKLTVEGMTLEELPVKIYEDDEIPSDVKISISAELHHTSEEISPAYKTALEFMQPQSFSPPTVQQSRNGSQVVRIFFLKEKQRDQVESFADVSVKLKNQLVQEATEAESITYMNELKSKFGFNQEAFDALLSSKFEPVSINVSQE